MTTVNDAKRLVDESAMVLPAITIPLLESLGMILATPVVSAVDMPPFDQSAMDGYAFHFEAFNPKLPLRVIGEIPAGKQAALRPAPGEAMRIFTGAPVPEGTDTVVMQEKVRIKGDQIWIDDFLLKKGSNVRPCGSQTRQGETALSPGTHLNPAAIGFLAGLGVTTVQVWSKPKVCLIITGKELAPPGAVLKPGQVYESNSFALIAALQELNIQPTLVFRSDDDERLITNYLATGIEQCDLVIVTGGISVGDYDLVKKSMDNCQVKTVFYKVKQKPGKPLFFGKHPQKLLFGLPGNPSAVLTCFYEYIVPAIEKMSGKIGPSRRMTKKTLTAAFSKRPGLTYFLKGKINGDEVVPLHAQESYQMSSFALADCLIVLEENRTNYEKGEMVEVHLFPNW
ncbi:MAG: molybdopterin molybdotransferase MoeA [Saprospiraceae bacterium]|nr:molybdopterin molybdotransferase MoeA [Saprospiraceae bacterium]